MFADKSEIDTLVLSPSLAARMISVSLGESEVTWGLRMTNWRRPERRSPIKWSENEFGRPTYDFADVQAFIDRTLGQRAAVTHAGTEQGKAKVTATADVEGNLPFVKVFWNAGTAQGTFSLSLDAAQALSDKLAHAATQGAAIAEERFL